MGYIQLYITTDCKLRVNHSRWDVFERRIDGTCASNSSRRRVNHVRSVASLNRKSNYFVGSLSRTISLKPTPPLPNNNIRSLFTKSAHHLSHTPPPRLKLTFSPTA